MNRRDFMKWLGRLLAALPFVALADLESEFQEGGVIPTNQSIRLSQNNDALWFMSWEFEAPKEEVERLSKILAEAENRITPWQRFLELNEDDFCYRSIPLPDSEIVEYNL